MLLRCNIYGTVHIYALPSFLRFVTHKINFVWNSFPFRCLEFQPPTMFLAGKRNAQTRNLDDPRQFKQEEETTDSTFRPSQKR